MSRSLRTRAGSVDGDGRARAAIEAATTSVAGEMLGVVAPAEGATTSSRQLAHDQVV